MADDFEGLGRLKRLTEDAKRAAAVLDAADEHTEIEQGNTTVIEVARPRRKNHATGQAVSHTLQVEVPLQPVSLSTLVLATTKKRLARASHLQAASEKLPSTQWEIVDQAINEWCKGRGY